MEQIKEFVKSIWSLEADQIAIISLAITLLIFVLGKRSENKIKMYETRKAEYKKLTDFFVEIFAQKGKDVSKFTEDIEARQRFIDMGSSLAIYGSKKLYKTYTFYRWICLDENLQKNRWYSKDMALYCMGEMYKIMRKEIGLNNDLIPVDVPDVLSYNLTDFIKPEFKKNYYKYKFKKFAIKSAIFWGKVESFLPIVWFYNCLIKPFFFTIFCILRFPIKLIIVTPIKQIKKHINKTK